MPLQVQATFAGGLSEHLQAAGGANASVAASLHESLGTAAQLVDDLKTGIHEGQNKLIQLASQKSKHVSLLLQDIALCEELMPRPCFTACDRCYPLKHEHTDKNRQFQLRTAKAGFSACKRALLHSTLMPEAAALNAHHTSAQQMH